MPLDCFSTAKATIEPQGPSFDPVRIDKCSFDRNDNSLPDTPRRRFERQLGIENKAWVDWVDWDNWVDWVDWVG